LLGTVEQWHRRRGKEGRKEKTSLRRGRRVRAPGTGGLGEEEEWGYSLGMSDTAQAYEVGSVVRVTKQLVLGDGPSCFVVEGEIVRMGQQKTGSWYAHAKEKKLWLDRLELKKADGELVVVNLDEGAVVEALGGGARD